MSTVNIAYTAAHWKLSPNMSKVGLNKHNNNYLSQNSSF